MIIIDTFKEECEQLEQDRKSLKERLEVIISDKLIPLDLRWELFIKVPNSLKNKDKYIVDFKTLQKDCKHFNWYTTFHYEKYQEIHLHDLVDNISSIVSQLEADTEGVPTYIKCYAGKYFATREGLAELKEEILEKNLVSFIFDW